MIFHYHQHDLVLPMVSDPVITADDHQTVSVVQCPECRRWGLTLYHRRGTFGQGYPDAPARFNGLPIRWIVVKDIGDGFVQGYPYRNLLYLSEQATAGRVIFPLFAAKTFQGWLGATDRVESADGLVIYQASHFQRYIPQYRWLSNPNAPKLYWGLRQIHLDILTWGFDKKPRPYSRKIDLRLVTIMRQRVRRYHRNPFGLISKSEKCDWCNAAPAKTVYNDVFRGTVSLCWSCGRQASHVMVNVADIPWMKGGDAKKRKRKR